MLRHPDFLKIVSRHPDFFENFVATSKFFEKFCRGTQNLGGVRGKMSDKLPLMSDYRVVSEAGVR